MKSQVPRKRETDRRHGSVESNPRRSIYRGTIVCTTERSCRHLLLSTSIVKINENRLLISRFRENGIILPRQVLSGANLNIAINITSQNKQRGLLFGVENTSRTAQSLSLGNRRKWHLAENVQSHAKTPHFALMNEWKRYSVLRATF